MAKLPAKADPSPGLPELDPSAPHLFYLTRPQTIELSDTVIKLEGDGGSIMLLPVHSQLLASASPVLHGACAVQRRGTCVVASGSTKRARKDATCAAGAAALDLSSGPISISTPFSGFPLDVIALFLRLVYHMDEAAVPRALDAVPLGRLMGVLRLSHQLDSARLTARLAGALAQRQFGSGACDLSLLTSLVNTAADCGLGDLHTLALQQLAIALAEGREPESKALALCDGAGAALNAASVGELFALTARTAMWGRIEVINEFNFGCFAQLTAGATFSPTFLVRGHEWRLQVCPKGYGEGAGTHLSLYLECMYAIERLPVTATVDVKVFGSEKDSAAFTSYIAAAKYNSDARVHGWPKALKLSHLQDAAEPVLPSGSLRVAVTVKVLD
ncbi:MAG: TRAF-like protein [Monoraphidium minutum]|nr:MAG: TRAF-like protein [Monoraphidium minutum]